MLIPFISAFFRLYSFLLIARILLSWFPVDESSEWVRMLYRLTDPFLDIFRKFIPPIGMMDFSPIVAIFALMLIKNIVISILYNIGLY